MQVFVGLTATELKEEFVPEIQALAKNQDLTITECEQKLQQTYAGYHFHYNGDDIYNPLSVLNAFSEKVKTHAGELPVRVPRGSSPSV